MIEKFTALAANSLALYIFIKEKSVRIVYTIKKAFDSFL